MSIKRSTPPHVSSQYAVLSFVMIAVSGTLLMGLPAYRSLGWVTLLTAVLLGLRYCRRQFGRHVFVLSAAIGMLGLTPISTDIAIEHMLLMAGVLSLVVLVPYGMSRRYDSSQLVKFPLRLGRPWGRREYAYIIVAAVGAYLIMPIYLYGTGSYANWSAPLDVGSIVRLFIGTNALGIWDELFFVGVCLAVFRHYVAFGIANVMQAMLWTAFLYELGFKGWGVGVIFMFALSQGYVFRQTKSILYVVTVHLMIDFVLFLTLIHLHNPHVLRVFITSPV